MIQHIHEALEESACALARLRGDRSTIAAREAAIRGNYNSHLNYFGTGQCCGSLKVFA